MEPIIITTNTQNLTKSTAFSTELKENWEEVLTKDLNEWIADIQDNGIVEGMELVIHKIDTHIINDKAVCFLWWQRLESTN